jgi:signal recognition particle subunit SRP54
MFESLTDKLQSVFDRLATKGKLTETDVNAAMREVRLALLEADVNYKVVKDFVERVKARAIGAEVMESLTPAQQVVKIVHEELIELLGKPAPLNTSGSRRTSIMLVGLQGAGKTTMASKLALRLKKAASARCWWQPTSTARPPSSSLEVLGAQIDVPVYSAGTQTPASTIAKDALKLAREKAFNVVIIDTAGRLQIDDALMQELEQVRMVARPADILLVVDAMTGQEAVNVAEGFNTRVPLTGLIMTKIDGDARGGAALSVRQVTGVPIKFLGTGEKLADLEPFDPERLAGRILGMGDVLSLIERAQENISEADADGDGEAAHRGQLRLRGLSGSTQAGQAPRPDHRHPGHDPGHEPHGQRHRPDAGAGQPQED